MGERFFTFGLIVISISWLMYLLIIEVKWTTKLSVEIIQYVANRQPEPSNASYSDIIDESNCVLYIAPTSLSFDGMGIYTTRAVEQSDIVAQSDSPSIPLVDIYALNLHRNDWLPLFNTYIWSDGQGSSDLTFEAFQAPDAHMTLGMFPNHHSFLKSVTYSYPEDPYDDTLAQSSTSTSSNYALIRSENSGGFSYHSGRTFTSSRKLEAGEELFIYYGEQFLDARSSLDLVARRQDYFDVAAIISSTLDTFHINFTNFPVDPSNSKDSTLLDSVLYLINQKLDQMTENVQRKASLVPSSQAELVRVLITAAKLELDQSTPYILETALAKELSVKKRTVEWIVGNGYCVDNIISNKSSIPGAGRGAFARRRISKNSTIVHTPMLQILHKDALNLYHVQVDAKGRFTRNDHVKIGMQLLFNYCMGHRESNFLLCPTTNSMLINHCAKQDAHCSGPNAYFKWSVDESTKAWRELSLDEIAQRQGRGLSIDFIASRDIRQGEEIFIDYGPGWIDAWTHHVRHWMSNRDNQKKRNMWNSLHSSKPKTLLSLEENLFSSTVLNRLNKPIPLGEYWGSSMDWVPDTLFTGCYYEDDKDWRPKDRSFISNWTHLVDDEILNLFGEDGSRFVNNNDYNGFWPCLVLKRDTEDVETESRDSYIVRIYHPSKASVKTWWHDHDVPRFLTNFPRKSIRYFHKPYQSDLFLRGAFRHYIEIPDDMFPKLWRDNPASNEKNEESYYADVSNTSHFRRCKFRPGDHVEVKVDTDVSDWVSGIVERWCTDPISYSIAVGEDDDVESWKSYRILLMNIRWSRTKRLRSSEWHPFF